MTSLLVYADHAHWPTRQKHSEHFSLAGFGNFSLLRRRTSLKAQSSQTEQLHESTTGFLQHAQQRHNASTASREQSRDTMNQPAASSRALLRSARHWSFHTTARHALVPSVAEAGSVVVDLALEQTVSAALGATGTLGAQNVCLGLVWKYVSGVSSANDEIKPNTG